MTHFSSPSAAAPTSALTPQALDEGVVLLLDKPLTWSSFDVVRKLKNILRPRKIGHAGTLDPLATGLLILCTGKMTKQIDQIQAQEKEYTGTFRLGQTTPSFDLETPVDAEAPYQHLTEQDVVAAAQTFVGQIEQTPPLFSAVKVNGERAYEVARRGGEAEIKAKTIEIKAFDITRVALPEVDFRIVCSKGTYVRSLARDLGAALGCGAHLTRLMRTRIGDYQLADAFTIEALEAQRAPRPESERGPRSENGRRKPARAGIAFYEANTAGSGITETSPPTEE